uniref:Uncharacterized protein n=1 Tax=Oryza glumipatula TaxID=40148 RepID=A0A0D9Y732_9ORYZ
MSSSSTFPDARSLSTSPSHVNTAKALGRNSLELVDSVLGASVERKTRGEIRRGSSRGTWQQRRREGAAAASVLVHGRGSGGAGSPTSGARRGSSSGARAGEGVALGGSGAGSGRRGADPLSGSSAGEQDLGSSGSAAGRPHPSMGERRGGGGTRAGEGAALSSNSAGEWAAGSKSGSAAAARGAGPREQGGSTASWPRPSLGTRIRRWLSTHYFQSDSIVPPLSTSACPSIVRLPLIAGDKSRRNGFGAGESHDRASSSTAGGGRVHGGLAGRSGVGAFMEMTTEARIWIWI